MTTTNHRMHRLAVAVLIGSSLIVYQPLRAQDAQPPSQRAISLDEALRIAEGVSEDVAVARAGVERARGQQMQARSEYFPQLYGSASYTRALASEFQGLGETRDPDAPPPPENCDFFRPDPSLPLDQRVAELERAVDCATNSDPFAAFSDLPFGRENTYRLGLTFSQTLFAGGRIRGESRAASAARAAAEVTLTSERAELLLAVTEAYYDAVLSDRLAAIADSTLSQAEETLRQTSLARQVGNQPEFELLRAQVTRDNQRPVVIQRRSERDIAYMRLKQILNLPLDETITLTTELGDGELPAPVRARLAAHGLGTGDVGRDTSGVRNPHSPIAASESLADDRAPVRAAEQSVVASEGQLTAARAQYFPTISLTSSYGKVGYPTGGFPDWSDFRENWNIGLSLQVPLFVGGRIRGGSMIAQANLADARARLQQTRELAALDTRNAMARLEAAQATWLASTGTVEQAARAYRIADVRYREGISTQTELSDSRILLQQAQANRAQAARDLQVARVRIALLRDLPITTLATPAAGGAQQFQQQPQQQRRPQVQQTADQTQPVPSGVQQ
jgi:outer membrane protein TolC